MTAKITTSISIDGTLLKEAEQIAQRRNLPLGDLVEEALINFVADHAAHEAAESLTNRQFNQGDIYWITLNQAGSAIPHPHVIVQDNLLNHSRISSVVVCALTSNIKRASLPGNVLLSAGEANLPKLSVVEVSKVSAVEKTQLGEWIGALSGEQVQQILAGMRFLQTSFPGR